MIPIKFSGGKRTVEELCDDLIGRCNETKIRELDQWCKSNIEIDRRKLSFREIIVADYEQIEKIVKRLDYLKSKNAVKNSDLSDGQKKYLIKRMYETNLDKAKLVEALDVSVCPYCNRGYLNTLRSYKTYQIDHFFPKDEYPILAVSFYNLVPSCYACNNKKRNKRIRYSPHNPKYKLADQLLRFGCWISDIDFLTNVNSIHIDIDADKIMKDNVYTFELEELYGFHRKVAQNTIKKAIIFPDKYVDNLMKNNKGLFKSREDIEEFIYDYCNSDDYYRNNSLSKLKADIGEQCRYLR